MKRELKDYAERCLGVQVDISSAEALGRSIASVEDATLRKVLSVIVLKTFYPPKYFCTGTLDIQKYSHYSLNTPLFTHFTAPSRRYADIVVQHQLEAALTGSRFRWKRVWDVKIAHSLLFARNRFLSGTRYDAKTCASLQCEKRSCVDSPRA